MAAFELDPSDRESLAEELLLSIGNADRDAIDAAWLAEAHRRDAAFAKGIMHLSQKPGWWQSRG